MTIISTSDIAVYCVKSEHGVKTSKEAFDKLESLLSTLKGRKFYGLIYGKPPEDQYFACVAIKPEDRFKPLSLDTMIIPGGQYAQEKIIDWPSNLHQISEVFKQLHDAYNVDNYRPAIEFYRSFNELLCRVPITI